MSYYGNNCYLTIDRDPCNDQTYANSSISPKFQLFTINETAYGLYRLQVDNVKADDMVHAVVYIFRGNSVITYSFDR